MDRGHRDRRILGCRDRGCHALIPIGQDQSLRRADAAFIVGASVFSATVFLPYLSSTVYHALPVGKAKRVLRILDHSSIFLLIAGTYAPFTLGRASHPVFSTGLYLLMGWLVVIAVDPLLARIRTAGLLWLLAGGLSYTVGVVFYATDSRLHFGHLVWHLFVMAGTACRYFAVLWYAA